MIDQSEILSRSQVQFTTLFFLEVKTCVVPFTSHGKLHEFGAEKSISWSKMANFLNEFYCLESHTEHRWRLLLE